MQLSENFTKKSKTKKLAKNQSKHTVQKRHNDRQNAQ